VRVAFLFSGYTIGPKIGLDFRKSTMCRFKKAKSPLWAQ